MGNECLMTYLWFSGAPKILLDPFMTDVVANAGEPFKIKIPFKGNPIPESTWYNVSGLHCDACIRVH